MTAVDWSRWRKCPVCGAAMGEPCTSRTGARAETGYRPEAEAIPLPRPHSRRKPRSGGA